MRVFAGTLLAILGTAGLLLPILPGWLFFVLSAMVLFPDAPLTKRLRKTLEQRVRSSRLLPRHFR